MSDSSRLRAAVIVILVLLLLLLLLLVRCKRTETTADHAGTVAKSPTASAAPATPGAPEPAEILTPATVQVPAQVIAGALFSVSWTGPNNKGDFVTLTKKDDPDNVSTNYRETRDGATVDLPATMETGEFEVRYVAVRSKKVLGRAPITIVPATATLTAPEETILGAKVSVEWTGPNNKGDYITLVAKEAPEGKYENFTYTASGSPLVVTAPIVSGDAELRYVSGQGGKTLARRTIKIKTLEVSISAPSDGISGSTIAVNWVGPNNAGDYLTVVPKEAPEGQFANYTYTSAGTSLKVLLPIMSGEAEVRYMTGQGGKVLARKPISVIAPKVTLSAVEEVAAGSEFSVKWEGPNNPGDYITIVAKTARDGEYANYTYTANGPTLKIMAPKQPGEAELRYMTGQGGRVLARRSITVGR